MSKLDELLNRKRVLSKDISDMVRAIECKPLITTAGGSVAIFLDPVTLGRVIDVLNCRIHEWRAELSDINRKIDAINELLGE